MSGKKKLLCAVVAFIIAVGAFFIGSRYGRQGAGKVDPAAVQSPAPTLPQKSDADGASSLPPGSAKIPSAGLQAIGIKTGIVEKKVFDYTFRVLGRVAADETRIYRIYASVDGWIKEINPNSVGSQVKKDELLATFYSPQFLDAQQSYIYALGAVDRGQLGRRMELGRKEAPAQMALDQLTVQRFTDNLRGLGMADTQIEEIGQTRQITFDIRLTAPAAGFITVRNVSPGQRFLKGTELYQIADLSRVWILADVFEHEAQYFRPGAKAKIHLPHQKGIYEAVVTQVLPIFDAASRTLRVRLEAANPAFILRPEMFADVELSVSLPPAITVPAESILYSGLRKSVFVKHGEGVFERRVVETGWRLGGRVEILEGLAPGEKIVLSGNFFIDSESRLQAAAQGFLGSVSRDPVCGEDVDETRAKAMDLTSLYAGKSYYFSSKECKEKFEKDPKGYVK